MFGATNILKVSDKSKYVYSSYRIAFDRLGSWSFGNDFARNVVIFGDDNSWSSHPDNIKNKFFVLVEGPTDDINGSVGAAEKKFSINFSKAKTIFCLNLHYDHHDGYLLVDGKKSFKQIMKISTFRHNFV